MMKKALAALRSFGWSSLFRSRMERDMDHEMRFHIAARADDLQRAGGSREEAERLARAEFGDVVRWKEAGRDARGLRLVDDLGADLRYAVRTIRRAPGFALAAIVSLALGIGASTAIFGLLDLLLLKPLPVRHPEQLVHVTTAGERGVAGSGSSNGLWFQQVASRQDLFSDTMLTRQDAYKVAVDGRVEVLMGQRVTTNYYSLLGVTAALGRTFAPSDRPEAGGSPVAVISHRLWQRRFAGRPDVLGAAISVDQRSYTIVGVTPPQFFGVVVGWTMDVTLPLDTSEFMDPGSWSTMPLIARLQDGVDPARAAGQLLPMLQRMATGTSERYRRRYLETVVVDPAARGISDLRQPFGRPLWLLMAAVALLLLIACVNLAGLLAARNASRHHELGMRLALGASRFRIVRQLLTESALLALLGAALGVVLGIKGGNVLVALMPPFFGPLSMSLSADWRVLTFALMATCLTTVLFGLLPAWQGSRLGALAAVNRATPRTVTGRAALGRTLVVAQFALSLVLIAGALLFVRTLLNLSRVETGFDRGHVVVVGIDPQGTGYEGDRLRVLQRDVLTMLAALPGVRAASLATGSPFNGNVDGKRLSVPGVEPRGPEDSVIQANLVGPGYFDTLQVPLLQGRPIDERDQATAARVAVVSDGFARRYFGTADAAIGRTFVTGGGPSAVTRQIVGVARDVRDQSLRTPPQRLAYLPWFQASDVRSSSFEFLIRTEGSPAAAINMVRAAIQQFRPDTPITDIRTMSRVINDRLLSERLLALLGSFFALVALTLAAIGVYGLSAHLVARRIPEIGVRLALGARPFDMMWMTARENLTLAVIGAVLGIGGALLGLRMLEGLLFDLSPTDTANLAGAAALLIVVSLAAAIVPARRAAAVDPLTTLRAE
jgi:predicted permease